EGGTIAPPGPNSAGRWREGPASLGHSRLGEEDRGSRTIPSRGLLIIEFAPRVRKPRRLPRRAPSDPRPSARGKCRRTGRIVRVDIFVKNVPLPRDIPGLANRPFDLVE